MSQPEVVDQIEGLPDLEQSPIRAVEAVAPVVEAAAVAMTGPVVAEKVDQSKLKDDKTVEKLEEKKAQRTKCDKCGFEGMTVVSRKKSKTQLISAVAATLVCCCCIPLLMPMCYRKQHAC